MEDNISREVKYWAWLRGNGRIRRVDGGERAQYPIMWEQNATADIYDGYGLLDVTPQDGMTSAFYPWSQLSVSVKISRKEERQNSGRHRLLNLLEQKVMQAEVSLQELVNNCIVSGRITSGTSTADGEFSRRVGNLDSSAEGPLPLSAIIDSDSTRARTDMGDIDPAVHAFWRNQVLSSTATSFAGYRQEMMDMYLRCSRGRGGRPDLIIMDENSWRTYWASLEHKERYEVTDPRIIDILGGTDMLAFRGATIIWDEVVPDAETNADVVDGIGTIGAGTAYYTNSQNMEIVIDSGTDFISTEFVRPENQDARTSQILIMLTTGTNNRRKQGVLKGIDLNITS